MGDALRVARLLVRHRELPVDVVARHASMAPDRLVIVVGELVAAGLATVVTVSGGRLLRAGSGLLGQQPPGRSSAQRVGRSSGAVVAESLASSQVAAERCCTLIDGASREVLMLLSPTPIAADHQGLICAAADTAVSRGLRVTVVIDQEHQDEGLFDGVRSLAQQGAVIGVASTRLDQTVVIVDGTNAVVETETAEQPARARAVGDRVLCGVLASYARGLVERMSILGDTVHDRPTPSERQVALLLAQGLTDLAAAKQAGVTDRTFRRHVRSLLGRLGAQSRFEAGAKAVLRGWL